MSDEQVEPETKGVAVELLATVDLGPEIQGMRAPAPDANGDHRAGRSLRPGSRPQGQTGTVYVLQGTITDHRDGIATDYGPGVGWPEDRNTVHWLENRGRFRRWRSRSTSSGRIRGRRPRPTCDQPERSAGRTKRTTTGGDDRATERDHRGPEPTDQPGTVGPRPDPPGLRRQGRHTPQRPDRVHLERLGDRHVHHEERPEAAGPARRTRRSP